MYVPLLQKKFLVVACSTLLFALHGSTGFAQNNDKETNTVPVQSDPFPWTMFLPALNAKVNSQPQTAWRVVARLKCQGFSTMTFTVTVDESVRESVALSQDFEGTYSDWAITSPGPKTIAWQVACTGFQSPPSWSGSSQREFKDQMNYLVVLDIGLQGQPVVNVEEFEGLPDGVEGVAD